LGGGLGPDGARERTSLPIHVSIKTVWRQTRWSTRRCLWKAAEFRSWFGRQMPPSLY
jgi:hypothetical protein